MRLFAAIDLTDAARAAVAAEQTKIIAALGDDVEGLKVVRPEHMHLTLAFAGEADEALGAAIVETMTLDIALAPFALAFGGVGTFPAEGTPRILWLGVTEGAREAIELQKSVASRFEAAGADLDRRPFHPHLTLARWRDSPARGARRRQDRRRAPQSSRRIATIDVAGVALYQSRLSSSGPAYVRLAHAPLRCPSSPSSPPMLSGPSPLR